MKIHNRSFLISSLLLVGLLALGGLPVQAVPPHKTVVVLSPFQPDLSTNLIAMQAMREEFGKATDLSFDVYYENLDLNRFPDSAYQKKIFDLLKAKYKEKQADLIIVGSETMLKLWLAQRTDILPNTPIVFFDVFTEHLDALNLPANVTGVSGVEDCERSLRWAFDAMPAVNEIELVGGVGRVEQGFFDHIQKLQEDLQGQVKFTNLSGLPLEEIKQRVAKLPKTALVLYHPMFEDAEGNKYHPLDVLRELTAASSVPVIGGYDQFMGTGVIGGYMYSIDQQARDAAQIGLRVLRGEAIRSIPIFQNKSSRYIFDHLALNRFDIPLSRLPRDSIIKNRQFSFWELYQPQIIATSIGIAVLLLLVVFLLGLTRQLNHTRQALSLLNISLETQVQERTAILNQTNTKLQNEITERERMEVALRESEDLKKAILNSLNAHIAVIDATGLIISVNEPWRNFARANGVRDLVGTVEEVNYLELLSQLEDANPDEITPIRCGIVEVLNGIRPNFLMEYPCDSPSEKRWFSMMVVPLASRQGGVVITHENITLRKNDEQALRESEASLQAVLQSTADGILAVNTENKVLFLNERFNEMWAIPGAILTSKDDAVILQHVLEQLIKPEEFLEKIQELYQSEKESLDVLNFKDGRVFERLSHPLIQNEKVSGRVWSFRDVTERKRSEEQLRESEEKFRGLLDSQEGNIMILDFDGVHHYANQGGIDSMTRTGIAQDIIGKRLHDLFQERTADWQLEQIRQVFTTGQGISGDFEDVFDNQFSWWHLNLQPIRNASDQVVLVMVNSLNITERKLAEEQLRETRDALQTIIYSSPLAILALDADDRVTMWNPAAEAMFGWPEKQTLGKTNPTVPDNKLKEYNALRQATLSGMSFSNLDTLRMRKDGTQFPVSLSVAPLRGKESQVIGRMHVIEDITERKKFQEELRQQATTDELTRISNRRHFMDLATREIKRAIRLKHPPAIALIDIDHFKQINDTYGHAVGDQALIEFTKICQKCIREIDVFARFGGDEFILLMPETNQEQAYLVVERVRLALMHLPILVDGKSVSLTLSSGVTSLSGDQESIDTLLSQADQALYSAKEAGRNNVVRYDKLCE